MRWNFEHLSPTGATVIDDGAVDCDAARDAAAGVVQGVSHAINSGGFVMKTLSCLHRLET